MKPNPYHTISSLLSYDDPSHRVSRASCDMKRSVCLISLLLFAPLCSYPHGCGARDTTAVAETICITNDFAVDIEYPNFLVAALAHLTGIHTDRLKFVEWDFRTPFLSTFLLHLTDDGEHRWFEIAGDSAFPSFVKLPLEKRTALAPSALNFFGNALQFLRNTGTDTLRATFEFGRDTLGATVFHTSRSTDSCSLVTTLSHIETWNKRTGEAYNTAEVTAVTEGGYTAFRNINIFLKKKEITLRLTSVHISVVKTKYQPRPLTGVENVGSKAGSE
jgi:hypothetical protein